jgi:hypothetical protein
MVTATIRDAAGAPQSGITVTFEVISGPNIGATGSDITDGSGEATFSYAGNGGVGTDNIQACFTIADEAICSNVVAKEWTEEAITLNPLFAVNRLDLEEIWHTVTATVRDLKGNSIEGIEVTFSIRMGPNSDEPDAADTTDSNGEATFTYEGDGGPGTDVIRACFTNAAGSEVCTDYGETFDNDAFKQWQDGDDPVCPSVKPNPAELPTAVVGLFYSVQFTGFGGSEPYTFEVTNGDLPSDFNLTSDGLLTGTPVPGDANFEFNFTITATDSNGCPGSRDYRLIVCPGIILGPITNNLPDGFLGQFYSTTITASEEDAIFELSGDLPPELSGSSGSYVISGTPTQVGSWTFTITASTPLGCTDSRDYTIRIRGVTPIPTLSEWGMIFMAMALLMISVIVIRRKQTANNRQRDN